ncbi:helix-turn-helix domain-containing protein [Dysgonomonas sp. Marseille-P4677]|uniref:GlxA family transcriptional regulator n=1 Tax=Dysgonomonas sp. Marseille-P4677 TaxID=2364790 RepID=UPI001914759D|nr:helix-turn-helix domain-containing protein [Dysgonomonas sp. Marseille-P4677]MBK5722433.1 helix-turn-helix domain-containing protein [Dysgonomonas sp. Marseille-P4677]
MNKQHSIKHIVIIVPPDSTLLNAVGPLEIFSKAIDKFDLIQGKVGFKYQTHVVSIERSTIINTSSGLAIIAESCYIDITYPIDTLIISGLPSTQHYKLSPDFILWIQEQYKLVRRICSVCSGAFLLAQAGILDGKKATAHWSKCDELQQKFPQIKVELSRIFVKDGKVYTSAGITSGMDLAIALLEEDFGHPYALYIARWMVLSMKRQGNQIQYSTFLDCQSIEHSQIRNICQWIVMHLSEDLTVETLAENVAMSPRNFARVFVRELHITPAKYINRLRVDYACRYLIDTEMSLDEIAVECGLKNAENLRRQFLNILEVTPSQYKKSFRTSLC